MAIWPPSHTILNSYSRTMGLAGLKIFFLVFCLFCTRTVPKASRRFSEKLNQLQKSLKIVEGIQFFLLCFKDFVVLLIFFCNLFFNESCLKLIQPNVCLPRQKPRSPSHEQYQRSWTDPGWIHGPTKPCQRRQRKSKRIGLDFFPDSGRRVFAVCHAHYCCVLL